MKKETILIFLLQAMNFVCSAHKIDNVVCLYNRGALNIKSVDYSSKSTTVMFETTDKTGSTLTVGHGIYLIDDNGIRHHAIEAEYIEFDSTMTVSTNNPIRFSVSFEPVNDSNVALDVVDPGHFSIYGIHDRGTLLDIPKSKDSYNQSYQPDDNLFQPQETVIEGVIHGGGSNGSTLLFLMSTLTGEKQPVCTASESGRFSMRFTISCPKLALLDDASTRRSLAYLFVQPGDHLYVEVYDGNDGIETKVENQNGEYACPRLANTYVGTWQTSFNYQANLVPNGHPEQAFSIYSPEEHWRTLMDDYASNVCFVDYMCWHNHLSPFESRLYLERTEMYYGWMLCELEARLYNLVHTKESSPLLSDLSVKIDDILNDGFYAMTKEITPDSPTLMYCDYRSSLSHLFDSYPAKKLCDSIPETETDYPERMLKTQMEVIHRITGWDEESLLMQHNEILSLNVMFTSCRNIKNYRIAHAEELKKLYEVTRKKITNPYLLEQIDTFYEGCMTD